VSDAQLHTLVLLAQQMQGAPAEVRSSFLHSPAGNAVFSVLSSLCDPPGKDPGDKANLVVVGGLPDVGVTQQQEQQQEQEQEAPGAHRLYELTGNDLLQLLFLPGLLLQPVTLQQPGDSNNSCACGAPSSSSSSSSDAAAQGRVGRGPTTATPVPAAAGTHRGDEYTTG